MLLSGRFVQLLFTLSPLCFPIHIFRARFRLWQRAVPWWAQQLLRLLPFIRQWGRWPRDREEVEHIYFQKQWTWPTPQHTQRYPQCKGRAVVLWNSFRFSGINLPHYHATEAASLPLCLASVEILGVPSFKIFLLPKAGLHGQLCTESHRITQNAECIKAEWALQAGPQSTWTWHFEASKISYEKEEKEATCFGGRGRKYLPLLLQ